MNRAIPRYVAQLVDSEDRLPPGTLNYEALIRAMKCFKVQRNTIMIGISFANNYQCPKQLKLAKQEKDVLLVSLEAQYINDFLTYGLKRKTFSLEELTKGHSIVIKASDLS